MIKASMLKHVNVTNDLPVQDFRMNSNYNWVAR